LQLAKNWQKPKAGNPTWQKIVPYQMRLLLCGLVKQYEKHCVPLDEDAFCGIASGLATEARESATRTGEYIPTTRKNGEVNMVICRSPTHIRLIVMICSYRK
jgi:hypothetical protein